MISCMLPFLYGIDGNAGSAPMLISPSLTVCSNLSLHNFMRIQLRVHECGTKDFFSLLLKGGVVISANTELDGDQLRGFDS